jgi:hypothetical protein
VGVALVGTSLLVATVALNMHGAEAAPTARSTSRGDPSNLFAPGTVLSASEIAHMVATSLSVHSLPADLAPSLAQVKTNWGGLGGPCWPSYAEPSIPACIFGDPSGTHTLALFGDSHAAMWFQAINFIAMTSHWKLLYLGKGGCPASDLPFGNPVGYGSPGGEYGVCNRWHTFAIDRMRQIKPDLVLITQNVDEGPKGIVYSARRWETATIKTIMEVPVPAGRVVILGNIPHIPNGGPSSLALHTSDVQQCSGTNPQFVVDHNVAERSATARTGARYINAVPWFCPSICSSVIGRYQPYWDSYHINADYSFALEGVLNQALDLGALSHGG